MEGWLMRTEEGRKLAELIEGILAFTACVLFIGLGLVILIQFRPDIQAGIRFIQEAIF